MARRKYEQRLRAESAERTRGRILEALAGLLRHAPGGPPAVEAVAEEAGVARSTVYAVFGSKAGLYDALARGLIRGDAYDRLLEASRDPDPRTALREGIRATAEMYAAERDVSRALYSLARLGYEAVSEAIARREIERAAGLAGLARRLASRGHLRDGMGATRAAHLLWALTSFDAFDLLYSDRGLTTETAAGLLIEAAERTLLR